MGEIIKFDNSINNSNNRINYILNDSLKTLREYTNNLSDKESNLYKEFSFLEKYISDIESKTRNGNWKIKNIESKFINVYEYFKSNMIDDELWIDMFLNNLIYFTDLDSSILKENFKYLDMIVSGVISCYDDIDISNSMSIKSILRDVKRPMIKRIFEYSNEFDSVTIQDIIYALYKGYNPLTIASWFKEDEEIKNDNLEEGTLTLDRIQDYYLWQEEYRFVSEYESNGDTEYVINKHEFNLSVLDNINLIEEFNKLYQRIYLELVKKSISKHNIDIEIRDIVRLTSLYLEMGDQITEFDIEDIIHYIDLGGKNENRRF